MIKSASVCVYLLLILCNFFCETDDDTVDMNNIKIISQAETFYLSPDMLEQLTKEGLAGNIDSGGSVFDYYAFSAFDLPNELNWAEILAENDSPAGMWNTAVNLELHRLKKDKIRSLYWLFLAAKNKEEYALNEIAREHLSIESPYPLLDIAFYKEANDKLSDYEIEVLTDYALRGGKKEAYKLYEYYWDYKHDKQEAVYWLRIGAQNKNEQCQYEYGKYLLAKGNENDKIRGLFWIKKAAKNGYEEAEKIVGKLEENEE